MYNFHILNLSVLQFLWAHCVKCFHIYSDAYTLFSLSFLLLISLHLIYNFLLAVFLVFFSFFPRFLYSTVPYPFFETLNSPFGQLLILFFFKHLFIRNKKSFAAKKRCEKWNETERFGERVPLWSLSYQRMIKIKYSA